MLSVIGYKMTSAPCPKRARMEEAEHEVLTTTSSSTSSSSAVVQCDVLLHMMLIVIERFVRPFDFALRPPTRLFDMRLNRRVRMFRDRRFLKRIEQHAAFVGARYWCVAGGFVSAYLGKTNEFTDVDIFFLQCERKTKFSTYVNVGGCLVNFVNMPVDDRLSDCLRTCVFSLLCGFDLPVCMNAIYLDGDRWKCISLTDDGQQRTHPTTSHKCESRAAKYLKRRVVKKFNPPPLTEIVARFINKPPNFPVIDLAQTLYPVKEM